MMAFSYMRVKWYSGYFPVLMVCLLVFTTARGQRYNFHNIGVDEGLVNSQTTCLMQDKYGMLWIGTQGGLSRFDGRNITNYTTNNGLLDNTIRALASDASGNVWIGSPQGLTQYNGKSFVHFTLQQAVGKDGTQEVQIRQDTTWWRVQGSVFYILNGEIRDYEAPGGAGYVTAMLADNSGMWLAKDGVVYHNNSGKWDMITLAAQEGNSNRPEITKIWKDKSGKIWLASNMALYRVQGNQGVINAQPSLFYPPLSAIAQDNAGALWLSTGSGVIKVSGNTMQQFGKKNGLTDYGFTDIMTDAEGNIWMASDGQGVFRFSGTPFTMVDESMGLPNPRITALGYKDSLFFGTSGGGVYTFKNVISQIIFPPQLASQITAIHVRRSKYWIGTRGNGLWTYDGSVYKQYQEPERNFPSNTITNLYEDASSRIWIAFPNGLIVYENDSFKTVIRGLGVHGIRDIGDGKILIGSDKGLKQYVNGEVSDYVTNTLLDTCVIRAFVMDGQTVWAACGRTGVVRYTLESNKALLINSKQGLKADGIYSIAIDKDGNAWGGSSIGAFKIHVGEDDDVQVAYYGSSQGIANVESNASAIIRLPDSSLWFATSLGAVHYVGEGPAADKGKARLILQTVKVRGEAQIDSQWYDGLDAWYEIPQNLRLPTLKNSIAFSFQGIALTGAGRLVYRYRLEGLEKKWSEWSEGTTASYNALPPGKYVLHVQCRTPEGLYNGELRYPFEIITPLILTNWFKYAALLSAVLVGVLLQYFVSVRRARQRRRQERLRAEELATIRYRTEEDFHDQLGSQLTKISVLTNVLKNKVPNNAETQQVLVQIKENTDRLYEDARDILWLQKEENANLFEVLVYIREYGEMLFKNTNTVFQFSELSEKWANRRLPLDVSHNLVMIFKEALLNARKHAQAANVSIEATLRRRDVLQFVMRDDGRGFDMKAERYNVGISGMLSRAARLGGRLYIDTRDGKGVIMSFTFRLPQR